MPRIPSPAPGAVVAAALALAGAAGVAQASHDRGDDRSSSRGDASRTFYATTDQNLLLQFDERSPDRLRDVRAISGLPAGVSLRGIDFRPATGDLYGVGSDSVVYRVNPQTAIAVAEGPAFTPALNGTSFGVGFNPTVDKIRVVSDARQNLRLNVDEGTVLSADKDLNPGTPQVVAADYTNSSFSATQADRDAAVRRRRGERPAVPPEPAQRRDADDGQAAGRRRRPAVRLRHRGRRQRGYLATAGGALARHRPVPRGRHDRQDAASRPHRRRQAARRHAGLAAWQD